jgi:hypothetical protein
MVIYCKERNLLTDLLIDLINDFLYGFVTYRVLKCRTVRALKFLTPVKIKMMFWNMIGVDW